MQIAAGLLTLVAIGFVACCYTHGYPNTVDSIAFLLHGHAKRLRRIHAERERHNAEKWARTLVGEER